MTRPMHVAHVLTSGHQSAIGVVQSVLNLARLRDADRCRLSVLFLREGGPLAEILGREGVPSTAAQWAGELSDTPGAVRFAAAIAKGKFDVVHLHAGGIAPRLMCRMTSRARVVAHYHSLFEESGVASLKQRTGSFAHLVIANSRATAKTIASATPIVIHPGVAVGKNRQRDQSSGDAILFGVAARLVSIKGIGDLIRAIDLLARRGIDARLEIAGTGPEDGSLRELVTSLGLADRVSFLGWVENVQECMNRWDVYVQPSLAEGFGISVLEAMASGLPVVATRVGGLPEVVLEGETGFLVSPSNPEELADRMSRFAGAPELRDRLGERGRTLALTEFSAERETSDILSAYEKLLA